MKQIRFYIIAVWGILSFILLASEHQDFKWFVLSKIVALVSIGCCILVAKYCLKRGLIEIGESDEA